MFLLLLDCLSYSLHVLDAGASAPTVAVLSASSRPPPNRVAGPAVREALAAISPAVSLFRCFVWKGKRLKNSRLNRLALAFPSRLLF